ncbi:MAG: hypothetical protein BWK79_11020, partial [Beggiatoa sp. IS2]
MSPLQAATPPGLPNVVIPGLTQQGVISSSPPQDAFSLPLAMNQISKVVSITLSGTEKQTTFVDGVQNIYGLSMTGDVNLLDNNTSSLKIILVDNSSQKEYLVYETYPALVDNLTFSVQEVCEETCILPFITTFSLRIESENASINIRELVYTDMVPPFSVEQTGLGMKSNREMAKIQKLNEQNLGWVAGETSVSKLSYEEKKRLFIEPIVPNLNGFEYYRGGVFEIPGTPSLPSASTLVANFSWGNRHGENWITPVKDQGGCGSCGVFASTGALEAVTNVYFNQHLDLDLSEQDVISCSPLKSSCQMGWLPSSILDFFRNTGLVDEMCLGYSATDQICSKCQDPTELVKVSGKIDFPSKYYSNSSLPRTEDTLKRLIIENGPVSGGISTLSHAMALIGFETDSSDGRIVWIFKNSWGQDWGSRRLDSKWGEGNAEGGYARVKLDINNIEWTHAIVNPIISVNRPYQINCVDKDNDQFCNWGLSKNKPATCPAFCKVTPDCDDSNPNVASFDANYNCVGGDDPTPLEKTFTIYNDGNADLVINSIVPETSAPWLSILAATPFTILPGSSKAVPVQIASSAPNGTVRLLVNSNDPDENPYPNGVNIEVRRKSGSLPIATRPDSLPLLNESTVQ